MRTKLQRVGHEMASMATSVT